MAVVELDRISKRYKGTPTPAVDDVSLGRAIVCEPKVFLFDGPLCNLDAALRVSTCNELARLHHRLGATMV